MYSEILQPRRQYFLCIQETRVPGPVTFGRALTDVSLVQCEDRTLLLTELIERILDFLFNKRLLKIF